MRIGSQETFKQNIQKITKKGTNPLPLWFDSPESMDGISNKLGSLQECFKIMDVRKKSNSENDIFLNIFKDRIDAYELFAVMLLMVEGAFETKLGSNFYFFEHENDNMEQTLSKFLEANNQMLSPKERCIGF